MADGADSVSLAQEAFRYERDLFERDFERFLTSRTPVESRRSDAIETIRRLGAIGERLHAQGVL